MTDLDADISTFQLSIIKHKCKGERKILKWRLSLPLTILLPEE